MENKKCVILKIGGKLIENDGILNDLCDRLVGYYPDCILVHGGGTLAGQLATKLGLEVKMHEGRRITDRNTLEVTVMAYAGWANKKVVAALQKRGVNACGLSGCDMQIITSHKREVKDIDWGYVGDIDCVKAGPLAGLLEQKVMPVISPVTFDMQGQLLNTNADSVAAAVAVAMSGYYEVELIYCFDKPGVLRNIEEPESVIPEIDRDRYEEYVAAGWIHSGMMPKLENAFRTLAAGVKSVRLTDPEHLNGGTVVKDTSRNR